MPEFSLTSRSLPDLHIVALHGELDLASADGLAEALVEIAGSTLVVDLADLSFMDSSGIGALVVARNRIRAKGARGAGGHQTECDRPEGIGDRGAR